MSGKLYDIYENAKDMTMNEAYAYCRKLEEDRERKHRATGAGKLEASTLSLDQLADSFEDASKIQIFSDNGKGGRIIRAGERAETVSAALSRLSPSDRTFVKAVLGGKGWRELVVPKVTFYRRLKKIEKFFSAVKQG